MSLDAAAAPWYQPVAPPDALDRRLACSWTAVPTGRHRLVPDACLDLVWLSSGETMLCGPETSAWSFRLPSGSVAAGAWARAHDPAAVAGSAAASLRKSRRSSLSFSMRCPELVMLVMW